MLSALDFETARPPRPRDPGRADVACFVGTVLRRPGGLPGPVLDGLEAAGWLRGPWALEAERIAALEQVPVAFDSWDAFDGVFDWASRPVRDGAPGVGATWLGAAVRSFFAQGGRTAVVVRVGDPWPFVEARQGGGEAPGDPEDGAGAVVRARLGALIPAVGQDPRPFDPTDPSSWVGIEHLFGLPEVSHLCLPDLADILAAEPVPLHLDDPPPPPPEVFVPCGVELPPPPGDQGLRSVAAPRLDDDGYGEWTEAVTAVCDFLRQRRRDALLVASVPLPAGTPWEEAPGPDSAFVQRVWPWLSTTASSDLPERLEPPEGLFAGVLARNALERGTHRSIAGTRLPSVIREWPPLDLGVGPDSPTGRLGRRVCLVGPEPDGITILSDVTASSDEAWRGGGAGRLIASLLRTARRLGEAETFDLNGPALWSRIRRSVEAVLEDHYRAGALRGATPGEAFTVRCGRDTTTRNDLDNGRVRVEVSVQPAASIERIVVSLDLAPGGADLRGMGVA